MYSGGLTPFESLEEHWAYEKTYDKVSVLAND